ncbi:hypothetical protein EVAR_74543_1 [Eumeta japonica]|uniref:Uncharacterized protein n=1 Tax=Eumeta variegata TaxID=151549 RepID=A0A4C1TBK7_EUMVA|nr:hypothetical protein EVAR_74543_1 [Eumeta japonica]
MDVQEKNALCTAFLRRARDYLKTCNERGRARGRAARRQRYLPKSRGSGCAARADVQARQVRAPAGSRRHACSSDVPLSATDQYRYRESIKHHDIAAL